MPSRSANNNTKITKEKPVKQKPQIKVTSKSSPEDQLHASWEFLSVFQFFNTFSSFFNISSTFSISKLEQALLDDNNTTDRSSRESSVSSTSSQPNSKFLANFLILAITPLLSQNKKYKINTDNYQDHLLKLFPECRAKFSELNVMEKVKLLKSIEDMYMETGNDNFAAFKNENAPETLRADPLGVDNEGWTYWYFGDTRLYREIPIPNGKRGVDMMNTTDYTFELVCSTIDEWHATIKKYQQSSVNKQLATKICDLGLNIIGILETREANKLRNIAKIKRAKELELAPKKRSRRLEAKFEEEAKKQEILDIERQKEEIEEYERKKKVKEEKAVKEQERRDIRVEEARLKNEIHDYVQNLISNKFETDMNLKELRNQMSSKATERDYLVKMQGWISLLSDDITVHVDKDDIVSFTGDNLKEALEFSLFKNTLRTYITTLLKFRVDPEAGLHTKLDEIYKNLLLKRYDHIDTFCLDLNKALKNDEIQHEAVNLLIQVFKPETTPYKK